MSPKHVELRLKKDLMNCYQAIMEDKVEDISSIAHDKLVQMKFTDYSWSALHLAIYYEKEKIFHFLKELDFKDFLNQTDDNKETPLHLASFVSNANIFLDLYKAGASLKTENAFKEKPLLMAAKKKIFLEKLYSLVNESKSDLENSRRLEINNELIILLKKEEENSPSDEINEERFQSPPRKFPDDRYVGSNMKQYNKMKDFSIDLT